ncbi:MAG TPA: phenylalanine--tRNA ligase subunit alpha [Cyclobacteriaceae bacterium]|jgi:phenylalanyl-tRNA synthetase alpha chain
MKEKVEALVREIEEFIATSATEVEQFRLKYISRKGIIPELFQQLKKASAEEKKVLGKHLNELKKSAELKFKALSAGSNTLTSVEADFDITLPPVGGKLGGIHPVSATRDRIIEIFERIGFNTSEGPEIEDDWHNFSALNFPENHPAREMQDTFFIEKNPDIALRTHTSSVQIRVMENNQPPIRTLSLGRVFRNEAISARSHCFFHQCEGLYVDENVSFVDLKQTLLHFAKEMFGKDTITRYRPSYFPFTEPSAEIDISCNICKGEGCPMCKYTGWVEIAGSGMVDPSVLENCGIDSQKYTGFAFGIGLERIAILRHQIGDIRLFSQNDIRFLKQFRTL